MSYETAEEQLEAVRKDEYAIRFIKNPSEQVQLEVAKQNPKNFEYIKCPTKFY